MTVRVRVALFVALLVGAMAGRAFAEPRSVSRLETPHLGLTRAPRALEEGFRALDAGDTEAAREAFALARAEDPLLAEAWANLSVAELSRCARREALFAAWMAQHLAPGDAKLARHLQKVHRAQCEETHVSRPVDALEHALIAHADDATAWAAAARARSEEGEPRLALYYFERARELAGGGFDAALADAALRSGLPEPGAAMPKAGAELVATLAPKVPYQFASGVVETLVQSGLMREVAPRELEGELTAWLDGVRRPWLSGPWGMLRLEEGWKRSPASADDGASKEGEALLLLDRHPGDTRLALYALEDPGDAAARDAALAGALSERGARRSTPWRPCDGSGVEHACVTAGYELLVEDGRAAELELVLLPDASLAALAVFGDAGCGEECRGEGRESALAMLRSLRPAAATPASTPWRFPWPREWRAAAPAREREEAWRTVPLAEAGLAVDLPPGVQFTRTALWPRVCGVPSGALLWFRGRFIDREGLAVTVGTAQHPAWLAHRPGATLAEAARSPAALAPAVDPGARLAGAASLTRALHLAGEAGEGLVARFEGERFAGDWFVLRRVVDGDVYDLVLPVAGGRRSLALLWLGIALRGLGEAPPPPPVDLSARFDVRFLRTENERDPREGMLFADQLELPVPRPFRVFLDASSSGGFPLTLRARGEGTITVERWSSQGRELARLRRDALGKSGRVASGPWQVGRESRGGRSERVEFTGDDAAYGCLVLIVPAEEDDARPVYVVTLETRGEGLEHADVACTLLSRARYQRRPR